MRLTMLGGPDGRARWACMRCHGLDGGGDGGGSPRLAGLPAGYLEKQLLDFARETRPDKIMSPIARMLSDAERRSLARAYAEMTPTSSGRPGPPDPLGAQLYWQGDRARGLRACAECHGYPRLGGGAAYPPLGGQPAPYIGLQLRRWAAGVRRNDPRDVMVRQAARLTEAERRALGRYLAAAPLTAPTAGEATAPSASAPGPDR